MLDVKEFKDHKVLQYIKEADTEVLIFGIEGSNYYRLVFMRYRHIVTVAGDLGEVVYLMSGNNTLGWISKCNFGYVFGKCAASNSGRSWQTWDRHHLEKWVKEYIENYMEEPEKLIKQFFDEADSNNGVSHTYEYEAWRDWLYDYLYEDFDVDTSYGQYYFGDNWGDMINAGFVSHPFAKFQFEGLKLAIKQLEERDDKNVDGGSKDPV